MAKYLDNDGLSRLVTQCKAFFATKSHSHVGTEVTLTGYSKPSTASAVAATDNVNAAIGKLEKTLDGKQAAGSYLTADSNLNAAKLTGTVPANCYTNTTYSAGDGISLSGTTFSNSGVRSVASGNTNGTISVNTNGTAAEVSVAGLKSAAFSETTDFAAASHTHSYAGASSAGGAATTALKLDSAKAIDGVSFDGSSAIIHYGACSTEASSAAKTVACANFSLVTGAKIAVKFSITNTADNPTLNVNSTGAKAIRYRGSAIAAGYLAANRVYEFAYDGTAFELVGDINTDTDTTYSAGTGLTLTSTTFSLNTANATQLGGVTLSDSSSSTSGASDGIAATPAAVKDVSDLIDGLYEGCDEFTH